MSEKKLTDYQAARKWTLQALQLEPERRDIQILANDVLYLAQDPAVLEQVLDKLCAANPENSSYLARKGYLLWNKGEKDAARKLLDAALACPEPSLENRMVILNLLGRSSDALRILGATEESRRKENPEYKPEATLLVYRVMCLRMGGDARQAIGTYVKLVQGEGPGYLKERTVRSLDYPRDVVEALVKTRKEAFERHSELKEPEKD